MTPEQKAVLEFHKKFGLLVQETPAFPDEKTERLRYDLIREELGELGDAMGAADLTGVADALGDLLYVVLGAAVSFGIDLEPVFREIHDSNMAKEGGAMREDGKLLKPEGWQPPDIAGVLEKQK